MRKGRGGGGEGREGGGQCVCSVFRPMCLLQRHNVRLMQLQPDEQFSVKGRGEAAAVVA